MAKKAKGKAKVTTITVADLAEEYGMEGRRIRQIIRGLGMKAPEVEREGGEFGPRAKYEWKSNSKDLAKIRKAVVEAAKADSEKPKAEKKGKGKKKAEADEPDVEEDDDDEDDEDEDDEEEDEDDE